MVTSSGWTFLSIFLTTLPLLNRANGESTDEQGIVRLIQELGKEQVPEPVWMFHEPGSVLDDTWTPSAHDQGSADNSHQKDLVQPHEQNLEGVPVFIKQPESVYYAWRGKPAVVECIAEPVSHAVIYCADKTFPYMEHEHSKEQRLQVTRLDSNGNLDADGHRWKMSLSVNTKELEEWFGTYICLCEVWNMIPELKQDRKVFSRNATIVEAYLDREFQLEPIPEQLVKGQRLLLSCQPPKGDPTPKVYWLKNGKRVDKQTYPHIIIDDYNRLIIEHVETQDAGNYTCAADVLGIGQRYSTAEVTVLPYKKENQVRLSMTPWSIWGACQLDPLTGGCQQTRARTCVNVTTMGESLMEFQQGIDGIVDPPSCPEPVFEARSCPMNACTGESLGLPNSERKSSPSNPAPVREVMFYVGLVAAFTVTALIVFSVCRLNRKKPSTFVNPLCPRRFTSRQNEYGKSMTILKNSQSSTYDMPPLSNGTGSLPRSPKVGSPFNGAMGVNLLEYSMKLDTPSLLVHSQTQRPGSGVEQQSQQQQQQQQPLMNAYNQPYSPMTACFSPMTPVFQNGSAFQSPNFSYLGKDTSNLLSNSPSTGGTFSPMLSNGGYSNVPPMPPPHLAASRSSGSSSTGGGHPTNQQSQQQQQQPIYLSPSSTSNTGIGGLPGDGNDDCSSSALYNEIGTASESIFPLIPPLPVSAGETGSTTWANIGSVGGVVNLPESGITVRIPPGAIPSGISREVYLATCRDEKYWPALSEHQMLVSSVIQVGLPGAPLAKPVIVSFPHCANLSGQGVWSFRIYCYSVASTLDSIYKDAESTNGSEWSWKEVCQVGQEQARDPIHCHFTATQAHLMTQYPLRFCLVGQAASAELPTVTTSPLTPGLRTAVSTDCSGNSSLATETTNDTLPPPQTSGVPLSKRLRLLAFTGRMSAATNSCCLRIYAVLDTPDAVRHVKDTEAKLDGQLTGAGKQMLFKSTAGGLVFRIQEVSPQWRTRLSCQEIPFSHIWSGNRNILLHCAFTLERVDESSPGLQCTIACQQDGVAGTQQLLHLNVNSGSPEGKLLQTSQTGNSSAFCEQLDFRLPAYVVSQLCSLLDPIVPLGNDWRQLAQHLNMERFLPYFASTQRPTEMVLSLWEASTSHKGALANQELIGIFQSMHRLDCVNLVRSQTVSLRCDHV